MFTSRPFFSHFYSCVGFIIACSIICSCTTDAVSSYNTEGTWQTSGLSGEDVYVLRTSGQAVYAATDTDLFRGTWSAEPEWSGLDLKSQMVEGEYVRDFMVYNESEILGGIGHASGLGGTEYWDHFVPFFYTANGGGTWEPIENEFTENGAIFNRLAATPEKDTLYALNGGNVVRSTDRGQSWIPIHWRAGYDEWAPQTNSFFIAVDPQNTKNIWTGGMTIVFSPYLHASFDRGATWKRLTPFDNAIEAIVRDLAVNRKNSEHILLAMDGIGSSRDKGETWEISYQEARIRTVENSRIYDNVVYASGTHPGRNVFIAVTTDFGDTWETLIYEEGPADVTANDLTVVEIDGQETVFLGTDKGVFSYTFTE